MDRQKQLEKMAQEYLKDKFVKSRQEIGFFFHTHEEEIGTQFTKKIENEMAQCKGKKKQVKYIIFSVLESSILTKSYDLQIAFLDKRMYLDDNPVYSYWLPTFIFEQIEQDMRDYLKWASQTIIRIKDYEVEKIRSQYVLNHYFQVFTLLKFLIPQLMDQGNKYSADFRNSVFLFGKYMERPMLLYQGK